MHTLQEVVDGLSQLAEKVFNEDGAVHMIWILETEPHMLGIAGPYPEDKNELVEGLKYAIEQTNAQAIFMMCEAWTVQVGQHELDLPGPPPSERPDRIEVVVIQGENAEGTIMARRPIIRPKDGKPSLGPVEILKTAQDIGITAQGRFQGFFKQKQPTRH